MTTWLIRALFLLPFLVAAAAAPSRVHACSPIVYRATLTEGEDLGVSAASPPPPEVMAVEWVGLGPRKSGCGGDELTCGFVVLQLTVRADEFRFARLERADVVLYLHPPSGETSTGVVERTIILGFRELEWLEQGEGSVDLSLVDEAGVRSQSAPFVVPEKRVGGA